MSNIMERNNFPRGGHYATYCSTGFIPYFRMSFYGTWLYFAKVKILYNLSLLNFSGTMHTKLVRTR